MRATIHAINNGSTFFDLSKVGMPDSKEDGLDSDIKLEYLWIVDNLILDYNIEVVM